MSYEYDISSKSRHADRLVNEKHKRRLEWFAFYRTLPSMFSSIKMSQPDEINPLISLHDGTEIDAIVSALSDRAAELRWSGFVSFLDLSLSEPYSNIRNYRYDGWRVIGEGQSIRITDEMIAKAKLRTQYSIDCEPERHHDSNNRIRIAYEWLDAQTTTATTSQYGHCVKHMVEEWAITYISTGDVEVAATLHPNIRGSYPGFNLSKKLVMPSHRRLDVFPEVVLSTGPEWSISYKRFYKRFEK